MEVNYRSEFDFLLCKSVDNNGTAEITPVLFPDYDWKLTLFAASGQGTRFVVSSTKKCRLNCINDNGQIHVICENHGLGLGPLNAELIEYIPNTLYSDKIRTRVTPFSTGITLITGAPTEEDETSGNIPQVIVEAYAFATASGYDGTVKDYTEALAKVPQLTKIDLSKYVTTESLTETLDDYVKIGSGNEGGSASGGESVDLTGYAKLSDLNSYVTDSSLNDKLNEYAKKEDLPDEVDLSNYVTSSSLSTTLSSYATTVSLSDYVTSSSLNTTLSSYATTASLSNYATTASLSNYVSTSAYNTDKEYYNGATTVTTLSSIPATHRLVIASETSDTALSLDSALGNGKEIHIIILATSTDRTITLPNTGSYKTMDGETSLEIPANTMAEINIVSDGSTMYIRTI